MEPIDSLTIEQAPISESLLDQRLQVENDMQWLVAIVAIVLIAVALIFAFRKYIDRRTS